MTRTDRTISSGMGAPDWDSSKATNVKNNDVIPNDGWIYCVVSGRGGSNSLASGSKVCVNGAEVAWACGCIVSTSSNGAAAGAASAVPVSKGDVVTITGTGYTTTTVTFYPRKN